MTQAEGPGNEPFNFYRHKDLFESEIDMRRIVNTAQIVENYKDTGVIPAYKFLLGDKMRAILSSQIDFDLRFEQYSNRELFLEVISNNESKFRVLDDVITLGGGSIDDSHDVFGESGNLTGQEISLGSVALPPEKISITGNPVDSKNLRAGRGIVIDTDAVQFIRNESILFLPLIYESFTYNGERLSYLGAYDS